MTTVSSAIATLKEEARTILVKIIAEEAVNLEAQVNKLQRDIERAIERLEELKALDVNDPKVLRAHFSSSRTAGYTVDNMMYNVRDLLDRI